MSGMKAYTVGARHHVHLATVLRLAIAQADARPVMLTLYMSVYVILAIHIYISHASTLYVSLGVILALHVSC